MTTISEAFINLRPDFSGFTGSVQSELDKLTKGAAVGFAAVATAATGAGIAAVHLGSKFQEADSILRAGTGAAGKELEAL